MDKKVLHDRAEFVRAMEMIMRATNDEDIITGWLMCGVADGDITGKETDEELEWYCEDKNFADIMACFSRCMWRITRAYEDEEEKEDIKKGNGTLYFSGVVSKKGDN